MQSIEQKYREKQDSLYILTSIKLDEAVRGRIASEENTKKELLGLIKMQIQGEEIPGGVISDETRSDLYTKKPSMGSNKISAQMWLMIIAVVLLLLILILVITKNKKTVYLKPKTTTNNNSDNNEKTNGPDLETASYPETQAHQNTEVQRSELQSLRQSAVSMSVSEKDGATQIVKDWLDDGSSDSDTDNDNKEEN